MGLGFGIIGMPLFIIYCYYCDKCNKDTVKGVTEYSSKCIHE